MKEGKGGLVEQFNTYMERIEQGYSTYNITLGGGRQKKGVIGGMGLEMGVL
jgi:hypothetical protein